MTTWNKEMLALLRNISMFCWKRDLVGCSRKPWHFRSCRRNILILFYGIPNLHLTTARSCIDFVIAKYKKVEGSETSFWAHFSTPIVIFDTHDSLPDNKFDIAIGIDIWWWSNSLLRRKLLWGKKWQKKKYNDQVVGGWRSRFMRIVSGWVGAPFNTVNSYQFPKNT